MVSLRVDVGKPACKKSGAMSSRVLRPAGLSEDESNESETWDDAYYDDAELNQVAAATRNVQNGDTGGEQWKIRAFGKDVGSFGGDVESSSSEAESFSSAVGRDDAEAVAAFLDARDDLKDQKYNGFYGHSPVAMAAHSGSRRVLAELVRRGASLDPDESGFTPLMAACGSEANDDAVACVRILLGAGANANAANAQRMTALMLASKSGNLPVVRALLQSDGIELNSRDTQEWSALCFAADRGRGDVARDLLEAGANPDTYTRDGVTPAEIAASKGLITLQELIQKFSKVRSLLDKLPAEGSDTCSSSSKPPPTRSNSARFNSAIETILLGLDLSDHLDTFQRHGVDLETFLCLTDSDLSEMGISQVGARKRIVDGIATLHKKEWKMTSLPQITPRDKMKGIYLTCADCIVMVANMSDHARLMAKTAEYVERHIREKPELLAYSQDTTDVGVLARQISRLQDSLGVMERKARGLAREVQVRAGYPTLRPQDRVPRRRGKARSKQVAAATLGIVATVAVTWVAVKYALRR